MKTFALKAMSACVPLLLCLLFGLCTASLTPHDARTTVKTLSTEGELLRAVQDDEVVVVLLQPKEAKQDDIVRDCDFPFRLKYAQPDAQCLRRTLRSVPPRP